MATNSVKVTLQIRHDSASNWVIRNPILAAGEYGLETDTYWIKVGDGILDWGHLPYLNKLDSSYFKQEDDGTITFSDSFMNTIAALEAAAGEAITNLTITDPPVNDTDVPNKKYVDDAIRNVGHLKRAVVQTLPSAANADENTLYMVLAQSGDHYEEYMVINGQWDMVGTTGDGGSGGGTYTLPIATTARLGGVKASEQDGFLAVTAEGYITFNGIPTTKLYVPTGDTFIIYGGSA